MLTKANSPMFIVPTSRLQISGFISVTWRIRSAGCVIVEPGPCWRGSSGCGS
jgi:hypothetical protein